MSSSKILQRMWSEMKVNFEEMMSTVATQNTLPKRSVLQEYQASVQDLIDIFDSAEDMADPAKPPASSTKSDVSETSKQARKPDHITAEEEEFIWAAYRKNYKQYLSDSQAREVGEVIHRRTPNVLNSLRKLIAADRNVPLESALDNAFSAHDDTRIWNHYLTNVADSYNSEGEIILSLSREVNRSSEDIQNRLEWLKHNEKRKRAAWSQNKHYTLDEDTFVQDETLTIADVAQITGRSARAIRERRRYTFNMGVGSERKYTKQRRGVLPSDPAFSSTPQTQKAPTSAALWFEDGRFSSRHAQSQDASVRTTSTSTASTSSDDSPRVGQKRSSDGSGRIVPAKRCRDESAQVVDLLCTNEEVKLPQSGVALYESQPQSGWSYKRARKATPPHATPLVPTAHPTLPATPHHGRPMSFPSSALYRPPPARQVQQSGPTPSPSPTPMRSRVEEQGSPVEKFLAVLSKDGMAVLVPLLTHDQVLALILGHMLHCGATTPLYDDVVRSVRLLMASAEELLTPLPDISTTKIAQIITLLVRAHCLQIPYIPEYANTNVQHLRLSPGIGSFSSLRMRHDAYLKRVMGPDASRLETLLWPLELREQQTMDDKMGKLMGAVRKLLNDK